MEGFQLSSLLTDLPLNLLGILVLYLIVSKLAYKPVKNFMEKRTARVNEAAAQAQQQLADAEAEKQKYEALLADSQQQASQTIAEAEKQAAARAREIVADADAKADEIVKDARVKAAAEHDEALASMKTELAGMAVDISAKVLKREITDADNQKIVDEFFAEK